ncbi:hypothetical protein D5086_017064 [Populus alba]|uniref:Uncharacterized protein n=1 Tax=Populus alba TaxID=43335 RepID=A0ACC4BVX6_POPAL
MSDLNHHEHSSQLASFQVKITRSISADVVEIDCPTNSSDPEKLSCNVNVDSHVSSAPHEHEQSHKERQKDMYLHQKMRTNRSNHCHVLINLKTDQEQEIRSGN